jgi:RNA polymerase sigma factor (sigma-70 family)
MGLQLQTVLGQLRRLACREQTGALSDAELLRRYLGQQDEAAFEALVWRHGPMVLGVCRRLVRHEQDAEDTFQAVFLAFARAAGTVTRRESVGGWLYRVACRVARKARARSQRAAAQPLGEVIGPDDEPAGAAARRELKQVLDEAVRRLPGKLRAAFVLCYLQGRTHRQAARELGWPTGTVATRLARARRLLRAQLADRGLVLTAGVLALVKEAAAGPPRTALVLDTIQASLRFGSGVAAKDLVSGPVAVLTEGALRTMYLTHRILQMAVLVAAGLALTIAAAAGQHLLTPPSVAAPAVAARGAGAPAQAPRPAQRPVRGKLLFYRQGHLTLIGPDGKDEQRVSKDRGKFMPGAARLSPDGKRVAFLVQVREDPPPKGDPRRKVYVRGLGEPEPGTDLGEAQALSWSPDGKQLVVTDMIRGDEPKDTKYVSWVVDVKTGERTAVNLPDNHIVTDWSRDGKYFLTTAVSEKTVTLHLVSRDGSRDRVLKAAGTEAESGRLSPDGAKVLYTATDPEREGQKLDGRVVDRDGLFVLDLRRGKVTRVQGQPLNGSAMGYCWSPDGKRIAHAWRMDQGPQVPGQMTESHLIVSDADGGNSVTIVSERGEFTGLITLAEPDWR